MKQFLLDEILIRPLLSQILLMMTMIMLLVNVKIIRQGDQLAANRTEVILIAEPIFALAWLRRPVPKLN